MTHATIMALSSRPLARLAGRRSALLSGIQRATRCSQLDSGSAVLESTYFQVSFQGPAAVTYTNYDAELAIIKGSSGPNADENVPCPGGNPAASCKVGGEWGTCHDRAGGPPGTYGSCHVVGPP